MTITSRAVPTLATAAAPPASSLALVAFMSASTGRGSVQERSHHRRRVANTSGSRRGQHAVHPRHLSLAQTTPRNRETPRLAGLLFQAAEGTRTLGLLHGKQAEA